MSDPLVSVIVPVYNAEKYLNETIESIRTQTYDNLEILLVNHHSSDRSVEIMEAHQAVDARIKIIHLDNNKGGPAYPRNVGMEQSNGVFVAFVDSDDVWLEDKLRRQVTVLNDGDFDIVHTLAYTINPESKIIGKSQNQTVYNSLKYFCHDVTTILFSNYININTVLMKKNVNIKFREDKNLVALEDWMFWIENLVQGGKHHLIKERLVKYRVDMDSISNRRTDMSFRKAYYLYACLLIEKKISVPKFILVSIVNTVKVLLRNISNV